MGADGLFGPDGVLGRIAHAMNVNWNNYTHRRVVERVRLEALTTPSGSPPHRPDRVSRGKPGQGQRTIPLAR